MPTLIKVFSDDDGRKVDDRGWCATMNIDAPRTLCTGEAYGQGESSVVYKTKESGKVTCPACIKILKTLKEFKY